MFDKHHFSVLPVNYTEILLSTYFGCILFLLQTTPLFTFWYIDVRVESIRTRDTKFTHIITKYFPLTKKVGLGAYYNNNNLQIHYYSFKI